MNAEEKALERKAKEGMNPDEEASFAGKIQVYILPANFNYKFSPTNCPRHIFPEFLFLSFPQQIFS